MATLEKEINKDAEEEFFLETKDFLRPSLKQINNSIFEIKKYFTSDDDLRVVPSEFMSPLKEIKEDLLRCLAESTILSSHDLVTKDELSTCFKRGFVFLTETLALALDFSIPDRSDYVKCDAFIVLPHQAVMVLTLTEENRESQETRMYNTCVARGVTTALRRFMNDSVNVIFGVMLLCDLKEAVGFQDKLKTLAERSSLTVTEKSLSMNPQKYDNVLDAFWAGVSEIKSSQGANEKDFISFLTKEQCILLVENINRKEVSVSCKPGTGATTLMLELAKRLSNADDTLMVCWCREDRDKILCWRWSKGGHRSVCNYADLELGGCVDLSKFTNVIDETGVVTVPMGGRVWRFTKAEGMPVHIVGVIDTDRPGPVSCPPMTFNRERVGYEDLAVSGDGLELVNWRGRSLDHRTDRLKTYWRTSSRLPIHLSSPTTLTDATYWETQTRLEVKKDDVWRCHLLEMAVVEEGEVDTGSFVCVQGRSSWGLSVGVCVKHLGHVCTRVLENRRQVGDCLTDTRSLTPGTDVTLKFGIALDVGRGRLAFIDVIRWKVVHTFDVNFLESLSPMFSIYPYPDDVHATMRLKSGRELEVAMTQEKRQLIAQALNGKYK